MTPFPPLPLAVLAAIAPAAAQTAPPPQYVPAPTPTADALALQMRQLGANPRDVFALIAAGDLSTRLGDTNAALGFFGRAAAIEPSNPRIAAGRAGALVLLERPGEALQLYAQAEREGLSMTPYLAQRGLAYDLIGQSGHAQRDYRRALLTDRDDETVRRLALSLGISGRGDEALALLDPLVRRNDRAAWRARACVLAVSGDVAGAQRIAATMMAGGAALSPFFSRLQSLSPADRAFAVHFGEVGATAARANDTRLAPALAALPVEPQASPLPAATVVASVLPAPDRRETGRRQPGRDPIPSPATSAVTTALPRPAPWAMTADVPTPTPTPATTPAPTPPRTAAPVVEIVTLPPPRRAPTPVAVPPPPPVEAIASAPATVAPPPPAEPRTPEVARRNTEVLASIIATIAVPASELDVTPPSRPISRKPVETKASPVAEAKKDARKPDLAKADAERWWVQVAGGANAADLGRDWRRAVAKSPVAFRGKSAWITPQRATNRLLAGPFPSRADASAFVTLLAKDGASSFAWQSAAGQKIERLPTK